MAGAPGIIIKIGAETRDAIAGIQRVNSELGKGLSGASKFRASVDKAFVPAAAALGGLVAIGQDFAAQAAEDAAAADVLARALQNTTGATKAQIAQTENWISKQGELLGISDSELRPALTSLATATGSVSKAQELAALAMDVSVQTGKPLETVAAALSKAYAGNTGALSRLVPGLSDAALKSKDFSVISAELAKKTSGAAKAAADAEGSQKRNTVALAETQEEIGKRLLPILTKFNEILAKVLKFVSENTTLVLTFAGVIAGLATAVIAAKAAFAVYDAYLKLSTIATKAAAAAQWLMNAALNANPIGLIILAIVALVAAFVYFYNNNKTFREFIQRIWAGIQKAVETVINFFKEGIPKAFNFVLDFVKKWTLLGVIVSNWDKIVAFFSKAIDRVKEFGRNIVEGIKKGISDAWNGLTNFFTDKLDGLIGGVKSLFGISSPSKVFAQIGRDIVAGYEIGLAGLSAVNQNAFGTIAVAGGSGGRGTAQPVTDEQLVRALGQIVLRSDLRNGRTVVAI